MQAIRWTYITLRYWNMLTSDDMATLSTMSETTVNDSDCGVISPSNVRNYERLITVFQTTVVAVVSGGIILSNAVNLVVLLSASAAMPKPTRLFLINLSTSDLLVGLIACAPAVLPAATDRWMYGDVWCQISGVAHGTSCAVSIWSISMVGLHRYENGGPVK